MVGFCLKNVNTTKANSKIITMDKSKIVFDYIIVKVYLTFCYRNTYGIIFYITL